MRKFLPFLALLAAGCAAPPQVPAPAAAPGPAAPDARPFEAWDVVASRLEVRVYRDGPMQKLGHNHVITSAGLSGVIELREPRTESGAEIALPLESLVVDDAGARAEAGDDFASPVAEPDRAGTRRNLLGAAVLDAARQPVIQLSLEGLAGGPEDYEARVRVGLRGEERVISAPVTMAVDGERMQVHARLRLRHADLGLVPFTAALGAIRVRDDIELDCRLEARRRP